MIKEWFNKYIYQPVNNLYRHHILGEREGDQQSDIVKANLEETQPHVDDTII